MEYLTADDLMVIDKFLDERGAVKFPGDTPELKELLVSKRIKISRILKTIKIEVKKSRR